MKSPTTWTRRALLAGLFTLAAEASAQITITSNDLLALRGKSQMVEDDTTGNVTVNVGSAGANQTWDFRTMILQTQKSTHQFLAPQDTPFGGQFPQSNFVQKSFFAAEPGIASYLYFQAASNGLNFLGDAFQTPDTFYVTPSAAQAVTPLPLQLGISWNSVQSDTFGDPQSFATITATTTSLTVDTWGRVRLPVGDFDCLRIRANSQTIAKTIVLGMVSRSDTTSGIGYSWISKNDFEVAQASSQDGETDPNFTNASGFSRLISFTSSVASHTSTTEGLARFELVQNFPNPFNPETQIKFELHRAGLAELSVYNLTGEKLRILVSAHLPAGTHTFKWNGKDEAGRSLPSGIYLYRLRHGTLEQSRTMLLLK
ncbi:MAG: FlgD immunoglobulin-like domain containing protein [bacterium]